MATYTYNEELADGGYVRFNVSPASGWIGPGMTVTVSGVIKDPFTINRCVMLGFATSAVNTWVEAYKNLTIKKNVETAFSISVMMTYEMWDRYKVSGYTYTNIAPFLQFSEAKQASGVIGKDPSDISGTYISPTSAAVNTWLIRCVAASAPTIPSSPVWTDEAAVSALTTLGNIVTMHSHPRVSGAWAYDSHYPDQLGHVTLALSGAMAGTFEADTGSGVTAAAFDLPVPTQAGTVSWVYTVTDMFGNVATATGSFEVLSYVKPYITSCAFERYQEVQTDTGYAHEASPSGEYIWLNLDANIAAVNSRNAWTATLTAWRKERPEIAPTAGSAVYENTTGERRTVSTWALAGSDGQHIQLARDEDNLSDEMVLSAAFDWCLRLTLTDALGNSVTLLVDDDIRKDSAILDVGPYGVSVGARSTALAADPQFECSYPARFYGDVAVPAGGLLKVVRIMLFTSVSIAAGAVKSTTYTITTSVIGAGWTAIGIVGYSIGNSAFNVYRLRLAIDSTDTIEYSVGNLDTSAHTGSLGCMVLCVRTGL